MTSMKTIIPAGFATFVVFGSALAVRAAVPIRRAPAARATILPGLSGLAASALAPRIGALSPSLAAPAPLAPAPGIAAAAIDARTAPAGTGTSALAPRPAAAAPVAGLRRFAVAASQRDTRQDEAGLRRLYDAASASDATPAPTPVRGAAGARVSAGVSAARAAKPATAGPNVPRPRGLRALAEISLTGNILADSFFASLFIAIGALVGSLSPLSGLLLATPIAAFGLMQLVHALSDRSLAIQTGRILPSAGARRAAAAWRRSATLKAFGSLAIVAAAAAVWAIGATPAVDLTLTTLGAGGLIAALFFRARSNSLAGRSLAADATGDEHEALLMDAAAAFTRATRYAVGGAMLLGAGVAAAFGLPWATAAAALGLLLAGYAAFGILMSFRY